MAVRTGLGGSREGLVERLLEARADSDDEDDGGRYAWEEGYQKSWTKLHELSDGRLVFEGLGGGSAAANWRKQRLAKYHGQTETTLSGCDDDSDFVPCGVMRNLLLLIDESEAMRATDIKPDRYHCVMQAVEDFVKNFFSVNPLGSLGLVGLRDSKASLITVLGSSPEQQIQFLRNHRSVGCSGSVSLQGALERALGLLSCCPPYGTREIVILFGSIKTIDPGEIEDSIVEVKNRGIRASAIGLSPEVHVVKKLCDSTGGTYSVALSAGQFKALLKDFTKPPAWSGAIKAKLVTMGFPSRTRHTTVNLCMCHNLPCLTSYSCPRCHSKNCELPSKCKACGIHLIRSSHLFQSYHHLRPEPPLLPLEVAPAAFSSINSEKCSGCQLPFKSRMATQNNYGPGDHRAVRRFAACRRCKGEFCWQCDQFISTLLHQCPNCLTLPKVEVAK